MASLNPDLWVVDGDVDDDGDGFQLSRELASRGETVYMLSSRKPPTDLLHLPYVEKDDFDDRVFVSLVAKLLTK